MKDESTRDFSLRMTEAQLHAAEVASSEMEYLLNNVANVFDLLQAGISLGHLDLEEPEIIISVCEIARRAMRAAVANEGAVLTDLSSDLRRAMGDV